MKAAVWSIVIAVVLVGGWYVLSPLFTEEVVEEAFPDVALPGVPTPEELADMSQEDLDAIRDEVMTAAAMASDTEVVEMMSDDDGPTRITQGAFVGADTFHQGSGTAGIYRLSDGTHVLRLENFSVTNGPDLHVIVSPHENPRTREDVSTEGYIDLGSLKGNKGNQNYTLPDAVDHSLFGSVIIYCKPFHVIFAAASLQ